METQRPELKEGKQLYEVHGAVAAALSTNRPELINLAIADVESGKTVLSKTLQVDLLRMVRDLITEREKTKYELVANAQRVLKSHIQSLHGTTRALEDLADTLEKRE